MSDDLIREALEEAKKRAAEVHGYSAIDKIDEALAALASRQSEPGKGPTMRQIIEGLRIDHVRSPRQAGYMDALADMDEQLAALLRAEALEDGAS